jgi:hypothetical protein
MQQETRQLLVQVIAADAQAALAAATAAVQRPKGAEDVEDVDTSGGCIQTESMEVKPAPLMSREWS